VRRLSSGGNIGSVLVGCLLLLAAVGALWTPFDPLAISLRGRFGQPGPAHWLGTDEFGRDVLSRIMAGAATSVLISLASVTVAVALGGAIGLLSGYARGWIDRAVMTFNDALLAFPGILLALGLLSVFGANKYGIILALGIAYTPSVARIMRGTVLSVRLADHYVRGTIELQEVDRGGEAVFGLAPFTTHSPEMEASLSLGSRSSVSIVPRYTSVHFDNAGDASFFGYRRKELELRLNRQVSQPNVVYAFYSLDATDQQREQILFGDVSLRATA